VFVKSERNPDLGLNPAEWRKTGVRTLCHDTSPQFDARVDSAHKRSFHLSVALVEQSSTHNTAGHKMPAAYTLPKFSPETVKNTASLLRIAVLVSISGAAIASRLFSVVNFESIIHEL